MNAERDYYREVFGRSYDEHVKGWDAIKTAFRYSFLGLSYSDYYHDQLCEPEEDVFV